MDDRALFTILRCAESSAGQVGRSGMLKILLGSDSRKLAKLKLDHLDEYGSLSLMWRRSAERSQRLAGRSEVRRQSDRE